MSRTSCNFTDTHTYTHPIHVSHTHQFFLYSLSLFFFFSQIVNQWTLSSHLELSSQLNPDKVYVKCPFTSIFLSFLRHTVACVCYFMGRMWIFLSLVFSWLIFLFSFLSLFLSFLFCPFFSLCPSPFSLLLFCFFLVPFLLMLLTSPFATDWATTDPLDDWTLMD